MTVMRLCYQLSDGNNIFSSIKADDFHANSNFELLATMFNATQHRNNQEAFLVGQSLLERFPDCSELLIEMSIISGRLKDRKGSITFTRKAMELNPNSIALIQRLKNLMTKL